MLKSTAIAVFLTVSVTTVAAVDMISLFVTSNGFAAETSTVAYNQKADQNDVSRPNGVKVMISTEDDAVKRDGQIIDATNYVDWKGTYRA